MLTVLHPDSDGYYVQGTYVCLTKTKLGPRYMVFSNLDRANSSDTANLVDYNERYTVGCYHPSLSQELSCMNTTYLNLTTVYKTKATVTPQVLFLFLQE
jgi:hypothetical protein